MYAAGSIQLPVLLVDRSGDITKIVSSWLKNVKIPSIGLMLVSHAALNAVSLLTSGPPDPLVYEDFESFFFIESTLGFMMVFFFIFDERTWRWACSESAYD